MSDLTESTGAAPFDDAAVEALLLGHGDPNDPLAAALSALRGAADGTPPRPSPELAAMLGGGGLIDELSRRRRTGRVVLGAFIAGGTTLALSGVAAAHDALPGPAQGVVTDIVNTITPFDIEHRPAAVHHLPTVPSPTDTAPHRRHGPAQAEPTSTAPATAGGADGSRGGGAGAGQHDGDTNDGTDHDGGAGAATEGSTRDREDDGATSGRDADDGDATATTDASSSPDEDAGGGGGGDNDGGGGGDKGGG